MILKLIGYLFAAGVFLFLVGAGVAAYGIWYVSQDLPDYEILAKYEPPVMTRIHAGDGALLAEYATQRRLFVPIQVIPDRVIHALLSAEDKNFYNHAGIDPRGVARAIVINIRNKLAGRGRRLVGASTITQQVAKNFLLSSEQKLERKLKEAVLALRIEKTFSKDKILELYMNEIYLGLGSYGFAAASLNYYGKPLHELNLAEAAYLAALPKAPGNYHPFKYPDRAIVRRNWVIDQMVKNGYVQPKQAEQAKAMGLNVKPRKFGAHIFAADYFAEEVRRKLVDLYGEKKLLEGGLSVRTTLDPELQVIARRALIKGLVGYDRRHGWRGAVNTIIPDGDWGASLAKLDALQDIAPWRMAVVLRVDKTGALIGLRPPKQVDGTLDKAREQGVIPFAEMKWARKARGKRGLGPKLKGADDVLKAGDVIYAAPAKAGGNVWQLVQIPEVSGGIVALDVHTGRIKALVGGFSYQMSQFDRAMQARRQPGSSFKPFVYAAALDNGYTPSSVVMDAPIAIHQTGSSKTWKPQNYGKEFYGESTLRLGIEKSRNVMTVRLAQDMGMKTVVAYARRFGIDDNMLPVLSMALGAGETTLIRMATAYAMLANGGKRIEASLIDQIQDRYGKTVFRHDKRECTGCMADAWQNQDEPEIQDIREQIINPYTAYQITSMLEGVVQRGTGAVVKKVGKPLAGKTGTTNDEKDAWFVGFSPDLAVGIYVGYDTPRPMGRGETGGGLAAPIFRDFMADALKNEPAIPFRVPEGINFVRISRTTGRLPEFGEKDVILEAFKPGNMPPETTDVIGGGELSGTAGSDTDSTLTSGSGGLY
ncbi:MAG: penicillin-binding protein [Hyphomicrobiales bacterium]|nr:MAG: penicillin-binding protein [Hyphomicrobiales bacterium]